LLGGWICRHFGRWAAVPAECLFAMLAAWRWDFPPFRLVGGGAHLIVCLLSIACSVFDFAAFSIGGRRCPHGAFSAVLACWLAVWLVRLLGVGFAAISTRGRWSLLGARWMYRQFGR
jgi:hypothetical protein